MKQTNNASALKTNGSAAPANSTRNNILAKSQERGGHKKQQKSLSINSNSNGLSQLKSGQAVIEKTVDYTI